MGDGFGIDTGLVVTAATLLSQCSDNAARAGTAFNAAAQAVSSAAGSATIGPPSVQFCVAFSGLMDDISESATGLGEKVKESASVYITVEDQATYRFGPRGLDGVVGPGI